MDTAAIQYTFSENQKVVLCDNPKNLNPGRDDKAKFMHGKYEATLWPAMGTFFIGEERRVAIAVRGAVERGCVDADIVVLQVDLWPTVRY